MPWKVYFGFTEQRKGGSWTLRIVVSNIPTIDDYLLALEHDNLISLLLLILLVLVSTHMPSGKLTEPLKMAIETVRIRSEICDFP